MYLLPHSQHVHREKMEQFISGESQKIFRITQSMHWSDDRWKICLATGGGAKRRFQYCTDDSRTIVFPSSPRSFRTQSYWSFITEQCCCSEQLLPAYLPYWMFVQSSFYHQLWINTWRSKFEQEADRQYSSCYGQKNKDPKVIDLNVPRHAQYLHNAWKRHQDAACWVDINLTIKKRLTFYQTRAVVLKETLPAYCIPKVVRMKTGEVLNE